MNEYDINHVAEIHNILEVGKPVLSVIQKEWGGLSANHEAFKNLPTPSEHMQYVRDDGVGASYVQAFRVAAAYDAFFVQLFEVFQEVGKQREEERKEMVAEFERMREFSKEHAADMREVMNELFENKIDS